MLRSAVLVILVATILCAPPARAGNDDSCDIGVAPAATLLLPYFEVDFVSTARTAQTTLFTVTNVSTQPQVAHVTLWTDWAYPALNFNLYLTPYDVQAVNLHDVFASGIIAPDYTPLVPALPIDNPSHCLAPSPRLSAPVLQELQALFTIGFPGPELSGACNGTLPHKRLGSTHANAIGYATVDVTATCTARFPGPAYFAHDLLFDNVLIGDYEQVNPNPIYGNYATGNPMVHIRAIPEGGPPGSTPGTKLPYTLYDRYTATEPQILPRTIDRRQPLPSTFAARWISGGANGFNTSYLIWREGVTGSLSETCAVSANSPMPIAAVTRFDEHENTNNEPAPCIILCPPWPGSLLPATSSTASSSSVFPGLPASGDLSGWLALNLDNGERQTYSSARASQNWVVVAMFAEGRFAVGFDAAPLGNGCSAASGKDATIGPSGGTPVCPAGAKGCTPGIPSYPGTNGPP